MEQGYSFYIEDDGKVILPHLGKQVTGMDAALESNPRLAGWAASESFAFFSCSLPIRNRAKLLGALPYALEEFLIDDADAYHFTPILPSSSSGSGLVDAHVVERSKMSNWADLLKNLRIIPLGIYPDIYALPHKEGTITAFIGKERCLARTGYGSGFCGRGDLFTQMLIKQASDEDKKVEIISDRKSKLPASLRDYPVTHVGSFAEFLTQAKFPPAELNAMHGDYAPSIRIRKKVNFSRRALTWAAGVLVVFLLAQELLSIAADRKLLRSQQALNAELFRQMFDVPLPDVSQLRSHTLTAMESLADSSVEEVDPIWERVSIVSSALNACSSCIVTSFKTEQGSRRININVIAPRKDSINKDAFEKLGWRILRWRTNEEPLPDKRPPLHALEIIAEEGT